MSEKKKLYRSRQNRKIAGVCGGLGEYFTIDPTLVRLAVIFFSLWWGGGLLLYLIAWFVMPEEPELASPEREPDLLTDNSQAVLQPDAGSEHLAEEDVDDLPDA
jgi:phage shock protein PspC (stress-responsive transcriptional regulator)